MGSWSWVSTLLGLKLDQTAARYLSEGNGGGESRRGPTKMLVESGI